MRQDHFVRTHRIWTIVFLTGLIVGCSTVDPSELTPITDPNRRLELRGFSILPPRGEGWFITSPAKKYNVGELGVRAIEVKFLKAFKQEVTTPAEDRRVLGLASTWDVAVSAKSRHELLERLLVATEKDWPGDRFRILEFKRVLDSSPGSDCLRYNMTVEDRGVPEFPGALFMMIVDGFLCLHPDSSTFAVDVSHSQRFFSGAKSLPVEAELEPFLNGLMFKPIR